MRSSERLSRESIFMFYFIHDLYSLHIHCCRLFTQAANILNGKILSLLSEAACGISFHRILNFKFDPYCILHISSSAAQWQEFMIFCFRCSLQLSSAALSNKISNNDLTAAFKPLKSREWDCSESIIFSAGTKKKKRVSSQSTALIMTLICANNVYRLAVCSSLYFR